MVVTADLRSRQAEVARSAVLEALVRHLEAGDADSVAMEDLAQEAGLSRRTIYRYFATRDDLLNAAGEVITQRMGFPVEVGEAGIADSFRVASSAMARHPRLARALLRTTTGRGVRSRYRAARVAAIRHSIEVATTGMPASDVARTAGVVAYLASSHAWVTVQDESGLSAREAQDAVAWAIETLLADLKRQASHIGGTK
ncbi:MAG: TetR/AcrR family transcriptional regulator [Candidatus Dormibacteria bacterium]